MNKLQQNIFVWVFPFYALWAFLFRSAHLNIFLFTNVILVPIIFYLFNAGRTRVPAYLVFLIFFTLYHLYSVYTNDLLPSETNWFSFVLDDKNVSACIAFFIIENTDIEEWCIHKLNRHIFFIVILALIVSVIQIKDVTFFISPQEIADPDKVDYFFAEHRNYSIFSWVDLNSLGVTFPVLIAILLSYYEEKNFALFVLIFSTILVCFLSKARYAMVSGVIVLSHLVISSKYSLVKKISTLAIIIVCIFALGLVASSVGVNVKQIINERIMEKGEDLSESSAGARITSYNVFVLKFPEHPWFGVGPHTRDDVAALLGEGVPIIHVGYLSYLYYYGIVGCFFFFFSLIFLLKDAFMVGWKFRFWGSFYGILAFCLANATLVYFNLSEAGIVLAVVYLRYYRLSALRLKNKAHEYEYIEAEPAV